MAAAAAQQEWFSQINRSTLNPADISQTELGQLLLTLQQSNNVSSASDHSMGPIAIPRASLSAAPAADGKRSESEDGAGGPVSTVQTSQALEKKTGNEAANEALTSFLRAERVDTSSSQRLPTFGGEALGEAEGEPRHRAKETSLIDSSEQHEMKPRHSPELSTAVEN